MNSKKTNENKKVVLVKGDSSDCYEQAIFIMKGGGGSIDFIKEAEKIICGHGDAIICQTSVESVKKTMPRVKAKKRRDTRGFDLFLNVIALISCISLVLVIGFNILM